MQRTGCKQFQRKMLVFDLYRRPFYFLLPDGSDRYRTIPGTCFSICTFMLLLAYASVGLNNMLQKSDYKILSQAQEEFYTTADTFSANDGFSIAAAVISPTATGDHITTITDPEIGTLKFYLKSWKLNVRGVFFDEIKTHSCS